MEVILFVKLGLFVYILLQWAYWLGRVIIPRQWRVCDVDRRSVYGCPLTTLSRLVDTDQVR